MLRIPTTCKKAKKFAEAVIKNYSLTTGDYEYTGEMLTIYDTNHYVYTDIRNEAYSHKLEYEEFTQWESLKKQKRNF